MNFREETNAISCHIFKLSYQPELSSPEEAAACAEDLIGLTYNPSEGA
jgi:hypothetical protein